MCLCRTDTSPTGDRCSHGQKHVAISTWDGVVHQLEDADVMRHIEEQTADRCKDMRRCFGAL